MPTDNNANVGYDALYEHLFNRHDKASLPAPAGEPAWLLDTVSTDKRIVGRHAQAMYACPEKEFGYE